MYGKCTLGKLSLCHISGFIEVKPLHICLRCFLFLIKFTLILNFRLNQHRCRRLTNILHTLQPLKIATSGNNIYQPFRIHSVHLSNSMWCPVPSVHMQYSFIDVWLVPWSSTLRNKIKFGYCVIVMWCQKTQQSTKRMGTETHFRL